MENDPVAESVTVLFPALDHSIPILLSPEVGWRS